MNVAIGAARIDCRLATLAPIEAAESSAILERILSRFRHELPVMLDSALSGEPDRLIFVDEVAFDATIDLDWSDTVIAGVVAERLAACLQTAAQSPSAVSFIDMPEMLTRFLVDVEQGSGFTRSWHHIFDGLKLLSRSALVRTLIQRDPTASIDALARLTLRDRSAVIALMNAIDAQRALAALVQGSGPGSRDLVKIAQVLTQLSLPEQSEAHRDLLLACELFRCGGERTDLLTLHFASLLRTIAWATGPEKAAAAEELSRGHAFDANVLDEALVALKSPASNAGNRSATRCHAAGVWLLLPYILSGIPEDFGGAFPLAFATLASAAGTHAKKVWHDRALREILGIPIADAAIFDACRLVDTGAAPQSRGGFALRKSDLAHVRAAAAAIGASRRLMQLPGELAVCAMRHYAARLPGFANASLAHLWTNFLSTSGAVHEDGSTICVTLAPPPLDIVWRISGAGAARFKLPDGRAVSVDVNR